MSDSEAEEIYSSDEENESDFDELDELVDEEIYITYHPEILEVTNEPNTSRLGWIDRAEIARQFDLSPEQINDELYNICPDFFIIHQSKIDMSRYGNLSQSFNPSRFDHLMTAYQKYQNEDEFYEEEFDVFYDANIIRSPIPKQYTYRFIFRANFSFPVEIPIEVRNKINKVISLHPAIKQYIRDNCRDGITGYPFVKPLDNEEMLFSLDNDNVKSRASQIGMIIPLIYQDDPITYFMNNIEDYRHINPNSKLIHRSTDANIFKRLQVYIPYTSRRNLLANVDIYQNINGVMVFTMQTTALMRRAKNTEISTMETLNDLVESKERIICVGNFKSFNCFTCSELIQLWSSNIEHAKYHYSLPYDIASEMSDTTCYQLIILCRCYNMIKEADEIRSLHDQIYSNKVVLVQGEDNRIKQFKSFDKERQQRIRQFYTTMFECGMYMRRWKGEGHPYPIKYDDTTDEKIDPYIGATPCLNHMKDALKVDKWLRSTPMVNNANDGYYVTSDLLERYFPGVYDGETCIRMASTQFIATAERSLRVYLGERIPNFNSREVSRIS